MAQDDQALASRNDSRPPPTAFPDDFRIEGKLPGPMPLWVQTIRFDFSRIHEAHVSAMHWNHGLCVFLTSFFHGKLFFGLFIRKRRVLEQPRVRAISRRDSLVGGPLGGAKPSR